MLEKISQRFNTWQETRQRSRIEKQEARQRSRIEKQEARQRSRIEEQEAQQRSHIEKLTAKAADLEEGEKYDLLFLHKRGFVKARGTGQSITRINGEIENLIAKKLQVIIKPGTYFVARGNCQNMVTRETYTMTLYPTSTQQVSIEAACINANLPIPKEEDRFYGVRRVSVDLARFLEASKGVDPMTVQAGVWALTDNYSGSQVKNRLILQDKYGNRRQAITDQNIKEAREILKKLGIWSYLWLYL
jgi:hypothetical protein